MDKGLTREAIPATMWTSPFEKLMVPNNKDNFEERNKPNLNFIPCYLKTPYKNFILEKQSSLNVLRCLKPSTMARRQIFIVIRQNILSMEMSHNLHNQGDYEDEMQSCVQVATEVLQ